MGMETTHAIVFQTDQFHCRSATTLIPLWGRWAKLGITVFSRWRNYYEGINWWDTRIAYDLKAAEGMQKYDPRATVDGRIFVRVNGRRIEQLTEIPHLSGDIICPSCLTNSGEAAETTGRFIANAALRRIESLAERLKKQIFQSFAASVRCDIGRTYGDATIQSFSRALSGFNWKFLLEKTYCEERTRNVVDFTLQNNPVRLFRYNEPADIPSWTRYGEHFVNHELDRIINERMAAANAEMRRRQAEHLSKAGETALDMLRDVLGEESYSEFKKNHRLVVKKNGYEFHLESGQWIHTIDPNGGTAELCIHTVGLSCHPIDEVVLAALNIEHYFDEFMRTAICHNVQNFTKPKSKQRA